MRVLVCVLVLVAGALSAPSAPNNSKTPTNVGYTNGRIVGGWDAARGQFPFIVTLQWCILTLCQHSCGGTIINSHWVLTAAHCITEAPSIGHYSVIAGVLNLDDTNAERQTISISQQFVHPEYQGGVGPHDIALFKLSSGLVLSDQVQALPLPEPGQNSIGESVLAGWGSTGGILLPQMPNRLQTVEIPLVPILECDSALSAILSGGVHPLDVDANICTGPLTGGVSACSGDSGGPLIQNNQLIGVVSWGITPCGSTGAPSVYTKVSHYIYWITETIINNT